MHSAKKGNNLRRTFATQLGEALHVEPVVIEKCLGHKMPRIMATYNKNEMLPQRKEVMGSIRITRKSSPFRAKKVHIN